MATAKGFDDSTVSDELALNYHLMHPGEDSAPGDPNLAYCLDGVYHLHYILRHPWRGGTARPRDRDTSFCFIHVTSPDMLHWTWQTTKLQPSFTGHGTFSGTGFITREGKPAAMYPGLSDPGRTYITVAEDNRLSRWSKPYPVLPTGVPEGKKVILAGDPRPVPGRRHLLRLLRRRQPGAGQVHRPGELALRRPAAAARPARRRHGRGHLLRQPVSARRQVDAAVHQPPDRLPLLPRRLGRGGGTVRAADPRAHELAARRPVVDRAGLPRLLRSRERAHRRRTARDVGLAVHRRPGHRPQVGAVAAA